MGASSVRAAQNGARRTHAKRFRKNCPLPPSGHLPPLRGGRQDSRAGREDSPTSSQAARGVSLWNPSPAQRGKVATAAWGRSVRERLNSKCGAQRETRSQHCPLPPFGHLPPLCGGREITADFSDWRPSAAARRKGGFTGRKGRFAGERLAKRFQIGTLPLRSGGRWRQPEGGDLGKHIPGQHSPCSRWSPVGFARSNPAGRARSRHTPRRHLGIPRRQDRAGRVSRVGATSRTARRTRRRHRRD